MAPVVTLLDKNREIGNGFGDWVVSSVGSLFGGPSAYDIIQASLISSLWQVFVFLVIDVTSSLYLRRGVDFRSHIGGGLGGTAFVLGYLAFRLRAHMSF